ncbi:MAG: hypothetical protein U0835_00345 [Isosphaeraceae bacterium]
MKSTKKRKPRIVVHGQDTRSGNWVLRLCYCVAAVAAVAVYLAPDRSDEFLHQRLVRRHAVEHDRAAMDALIDKALADSEAHATPPTAVALLELYGTDTESRWATKVARGE